MTEKRLLSVDMIQKLDWVEIDRQARSAMYALGKPFSVVAALINTRGILELILPDVIYD